MNLFKFTIFNYFIIIIILLTVFLPASKSFTKDKLIICMTPEAGTNMLLLNDGTVSTDAPLNSLGHNNVWKGISPYQKWNLTG